MNTFKLKNGAEIYLDGYLKTQLDSLVWNVNSDWDFVIIITGDGMVRTGKSVLALNIAAYLADRLQTPFSLSNNVHFDSKEMIEAAQKAPKNSVFQYDEAREGLATAKRFSKVQQDLIDFFNECGQLNHIFILVLPDFFSLQWELATNRSEVLINVYRKEANVERRLKGDQEKSPVTVFQRGHFEFFNRKRKESLYWKGKRSGMRQYGMVTPNFRGAFRNKYPVSEDGYRQMKKDALSRFTERHKESKSENIKMHERALFLLLQRYKAKEKNMSELAKECELEPSYFRQVFSRLNKKMGNMTTEPIL